MSTTAGDASSRARPRPPVADSGKLVTMALRVWGYKQGEVVSLMIHLGDRLGIYRAMTGPAR